MARIILVQRFFAHYRMEFFESLYRELLKEDIEFLLIYAKPMGKIDKKAWAIKLSSINKRIVITGLEEEFIFIPSLLIVLKRYNPNLIITEDLGGLPNSLQVALYSRIKKIPYLVWGLGNIPEKTRSPLRKILGPLINWFYKGTAGFIGYSSHASNIYSGYKKPVYTATNSTLKPLNFETEQYIRAKIERKNESSLINIVTIGRLINQKKIDVLIEAIALLNSNKIKLVVIGDGAEKGNLQFLTSKLGVQHKIQFVDGIYDFNTKLKLLSKCHLGILPGRGGLAIQEMMSFGIPVISGVADGTEVDLIKDGVNGYVLNKVPDANDLSRLIQKFTSQPKDIRKHMCCCALETIQSQFNVDTMTVGYKEAVMKTLDSRSCNNKF